MTTPDPQGDASPSDRSAARILAYARTRLGPASEELLTDPARQVLVLSRLREGYELEDALLAEVHRAASGDRRVADEFVSFFLTDLLRVGHRVRSEGLRRFLDTGDLVQSVLGDVWGDLCSVRFETRARFLSYLARRVSWKASDKQRGLGAGNRREDLRVDAAPGVQDGAAPSETPVRSAERREEEERLVLLLARMSGRDRELLKLFLEGATSEEVAERLGLTKDAARMAMNRAVRKARSLS